MTLRSNYPATLGLDQAQMLRLLFGWTCHRAAVDRLGLLQPFSGGRHYKRLLFLSEEDTICHAQLFPFFVYQRDFAEQCHIEMRELPLRRFLAGRNPYEGPVDAVCFQTWFDLSSEDIRKLIGEIRSTWPDAKLVFLDWFAPLDLRYAEALNSYLTAYLKKQIFRDFGRYGEITIGDTNLTDYYAKRFLINLPETRYSIPIGFQHKIVLGPGFEYSPNIIDNLSRPPDLEHRQIDLHARIATKGTEWYSHMRREAQAKATGLDERFRIAHTGRVSQREFFRELRHSKLCFSPFGYGEVCWRDFEAMSTGALLLKPDMSHLRLLNDFFRPYETYIPLSWDLTDLADKVDYYVSHHFERKRIVQNAFDLLTNYYQQKTFLNDISPLWKLLGFR
jgi:Glycosyl transferases group 1